MDSDGKIRFAAYGRFTYISLYQLTMRVQLAEHIVARSYCKSVAYISTIRRSMRACLNARLADSSLYY